MGFGASQSAIEKAREAVKKLEQSIKEDKAAGWGDEANLKRPKEDLEAAKKHLENLKEARKHGW